jgi:hypothetical protein
MVRVDEPIKMRDGQVANRPVYVVMADTVEGTRDILGIWAGDAAEGAKYWLRVFTELKNRGLDDVLMLVCDGLKGLPDASRPSASHRCPDLRSSPPAQQLRQGPQPLDHALENTPERLPDRLRGPAHPGQQLNLKNKDQPLN